MKPVRLRPTIDEYQETLDIAEPNINVLGFKFGAGYALRVLDADEFEIRYTAHWLDDFNCEFGCTKCKKIHGLKTNAEKCCKETTK